MRLISLAAVAVVALGAACSDRDDDVVQQPAPGSAAVPVSDAKASVATSSAAFAYGMTREQLEDADVLSADRLDLGDVETLVLGPQGELTHVVIELEGPEDIKVLVPQDQLSSIAQDNASSVDLTTALTVEQLRALPKYTPTR